MVYHDRSSKSKRKQARLTFSKGYKSRWCGPPPPNFSIVFTLNDFNCSSGLLLTFRMVQNWKEPVSGEWSMDLVAFFFFSFCLLTSVPSASSPLVCPRAPAYTSTGTNSTTDSPDWREGGKEGGQWRDGGCFFLFLFCHNTNARSSRWNVDV